MTNLTGFVKKVRNIMRPDDGVNGDAQRIEQIAWLLFLKVYDAKEQDWESGNLTTIIINQSSPKTAAGQTGQPMINPAKP